MTSNQQVLLKQLVDETRSLPDHLIQEVLDLISYLRTKYQQGKEDRQKALLATFGSWEDDRDPEEIVRDIYTARQNTN